MIDFKMLVSDNLVKKRRKQEDFKGTVGSYQVGSCIRKNFYGFKNPKDATVDSLGVFKMGDLTHEWIQTLMETIDKEKYGIEWIEIEKDYPIMVLDGKEFVRVGCRLDGLAHTKEGEKIVIELKSIGMFYTKAGKDILKTPKDDHLLQANLYMGATGAKGASIVYFLKNNLSQVRQFDIEFNETLFFKAIERAKDLARALRNDEMPMPEAKMNKDTKWQCFYCNYSKECAEWEDSKVVV